MSIDYIRRPLYADIAHDLKATYHSRMSTPSTDERNIDEILASIDEMLSQKTPHVHITDQRKNYIQQAAHESAQKLGLSSSADNEPEGDEKGGAEGNKEVQTDRISTHEQNSEATLALAKDQEGNDQDLEESNPRHRILLTEDLLEPSAQEALPLWIEQERGTEELTNTVQANISQGENNNPSQTNLTTEELANNKQQNEKGNNVAPSSTDQTVTKNTNFDTVFQAIADDDEINLDTSILAEENTELVEVMMQNILYAKSENSITEQKNETQLPCQNIDQLVKRISQDVTEKLQQHIHCILPSLVKSALEQHLTSANHITVKKQDNQ